MGEQFYTVAEAGEKLRIHPQAVYRLIWAEKLAWTNVGTGKRPRIRISESAIAAYRKANEHAASAA